MESSYPTTGREGRHGVEPPSEAVWPYLLTGYVVGFVAACLFTRYTPVSNRVGALLGGFGLALSGRSLGSPWRLS